MINNPVDFSFPRLFTFLLLLLILIGGVACSAEQAGVEVVRQKLVVDGEEIEVTRVVRAVPGPMVSREPSAEPTEPAVLDIALEGEPRTLDPQLARRESELLLAESLFAGLMHYDAATQQISPELAADVEVSEDGRTWTFHLRDDIFWIKPGLNTEGELLGETPGPSIYRPVVADDVVYAVQRACDPRTGTADLLVLFLIEGCEALQGQRQQGKVDVTTVAVQAMDDNTVAITLKEPAAYFDVISSLSMLRPLPREIVAPFQESEESWASPAHLLISGPFVPSPETVDGEKMVLQRNPFWPIDFTGNVDQVNIFWLDAAEAYERWLEKELDIVPMPGTEMEAIQSDSRLLPRLQLVTNQTVFYLAFNFDSPVFSDGAARRAFGAAIDREMLLEDVYGERGLPMRHFTPPGVLGALPPDLVGVGYNPDRARIEMERSSVQSCAFIPEIRYMVAETDLALFHAETVRGMWARELGCPEDKIVIEQVPFGTLLASTRPDAGDARPDIWDLGWSSYFPDAHNWLGDVLHCTISENRQNRPCSEVDQLIEQAAVNASVDERRSLYRQAEDLFFGEGGVEPITPLYVQGQYILVQPWVVYEPAQFGGEQLDTFQVDATVKRLERQQ